MRGVGRVGCLQWQWPSPECTIAYCCNLPSPWATRLSTESHLVLDG